MIPTNMIYPGNIPDVIYVSYSKGLKGVFMKDKFFDNLLRPKKKWQHIISAVEFIILNNFSVVV